MNVVSVIAGFVRSTSSEGDGAKNVPINHQSVPSRNTSLPPHPVTLPSDVVKKGEDGSSRVGQKTSTSGGETAGGRPYEDPMHSQFVLQESCFKRQSGDPKPWARYL